MTPGAALRRLAEIERELPTIRAALAGGTTPIQPVLDPSDLVALKEAARLAKRDRDTIRRWCLLDKSLGWRDEAGRWRVSRRRLSEFLSGGAA